MSRFQKYQSLFFLIFFVSFTQVVFSQLNIKIGYGLSYADFPAANAIINDYNTNNTFLDRPLDEIHYLNGVIAGFRYRFKGIGVEFTWNSQFKTSSATGSDGTTTVNRELSFRQGNYGVGLEGYPTDILGFGASLDFSNHRFRTDVSNGNNRYTVLSKWNYGSRFNLSVNIPGNDFLTLSIKPYLYVPWTSIQLIDLETELNGLSVESDLRRFEEKPLQYGIQFVFYNGQW